MVSEAIPKTSFALTIDGKTYQVEVLRPGMISIDGNVFTVEMTENGVKSTMRPLSARCRTALPSSAASCTRPSGNRTSWQKIGHAALGRTTSWMTGQMAPRRPRGPA